MSEFQSLVDHTRFDLVRRLLTRPGSPVTDLLFVESNELMCEVAEALTSPVNHTRRQRLRRWFEEGRVAVGATATQGSQSSADCQNLDVHSIDRDALGDVIYLPPYYLVHLAGGHATSVAADLER